MFQNTLYHIIHTESLSEDHSLFDITFNPDHPLFVGHFPNLPIVPGITLVMIIRELVEHQLQQSFQLHTLINAKFIHTIDPRINQQYRADIQLQNEDASLHVKATLSTTDPAQCYLKLSMLLTPENI